MVDGVSVSVPQVEQKKTGGAGKAVASAFIPGLGQMCDGSTKKGLAYLGGVAATGVGAKLLSNSVAKDVLQLMEKSGEAAMKGSTKAKWAGALALGLATTGLWIANIVDAYKGNKNKNNI